MRTKGLRGLLAFVVVVLGLFLATVVAGNSPSLGLDLQGGVSVVLQPIVDGKRANDVDSGRLDQTKAIIEKRVNAIGVGEPEVTVQGATIVVQLPGVKDQRRALELVGKTAELRFRPVTRQLNPVPSKSQRAKDRQKIVQLREKLGIPEGVKALDVFNAEQQARGQPTVPDPAASISAPATTPTPPPVAPPTTAAGDGTGGSRAAKVARLRRQESTTTVAPADAASTSTTSTTTTTIDPAPKNQYGIKVYKDEKASLEPDIQKLLRLETGEATADIGITKPDDDKADATVTLPGKDEQDLQGGGKGVIRYELGPALLTGRAVEDAKAGLAQGGGWQVNLTMKAGKDGIDLFNQAAQKCNTKSPECPTGQLGIVLDSVVQSAPAIQEASFSRDRIQITGKFSEEEAKSLSTALRYGSLPVTMEPQQVQTVSATLGEGALRSGLIAGALGIALVILYIVAYYRLLGLITVGALALSASTLWVVIAFFGEQYGLTLTLSGVVGIVVSVGISLDSSVVYFENLKEDVRNGRTIRTAVEKSFESAYSTIVKADFSSLIGAGVLYVLSIGPVKGFAFYLGLSTLLDLLTSYFFTRPMVGILGRSRLGLRPALFGIPTRDLTPAAATPAGSDA